MWKYTIDFARLTFPAILLGNASPICGKIDISVTLKRNSCLHHGGYTIQLSFGLNQTTDFLKPLECQRALGMESGAISDFQISASSESDSFHAAFYGRLHLVATPGSHSGVWASGISDANQWLQVDLGIHSSSTITRVATQGRTDLHNQWITKYKLQHCNDGINFQYYRELGQTAHKVRHTESNCRYSVTLVSRHLAILASG